MRKTGAVAALLAMGWSGAQAADKHDPLYAIVRMGSEISDKAAVGVKRAGLACWTSGIIHWKDVGPGKNMEQREIVQDVLEDEDIRVTPLGEYDGPAGQKEALRIRGRVMSAAFRLCARHWLGSNAMSGDAALEVEWRLESRAAAGLERIHLSRIKLKIDDSDAEPVDGLYRLLLQHAAKDLADWLKAPEEAQEVTSRSTR
jgi:hypothetical protein